MKIVIVQMNSIVGDFRGNFEKMRRFIHEAPADADLIVFPECALCGYPAQDLLDYPSFGKACEEYAKKLAAAEPKRAFLFGGVERNLKSGRPFFNTAFFARGGKIVERYHKRLLPSYDVFDEDRFFESGKKSCTIRHAGKKIGVTICEDIWTEAAGTFLVNRYDQNPLEDAKKAELLINISASPFEYAKVPQKRNMLRGIAKRFGRPFLYCNAVGANDGLIFDGRSYFWGSQGELLYQLAAYEEDAAYFDTEAKPKKISMGEENSIASIYDALVLGIRDYCYKQGFTSVALGLSGGIDSAVIACLAADALRPENVVGVLMPSRFTSAASNEDALHLARALFNPIHLLAIEEVFGAALRTLEKSFEGTEPGTAEENMQARIRGLLLMALSNKFNHLVLTTGNKSELAVGYCTLYGDMCGGLAPLSDVYKTQVYELGREANRRKNRIPERCFTKAPTAELRPNQTDQDKLPPYERLDKILKGILEDFLSADQLEKKGFDALEIQQILDWIRVSEFKRYQMAMGLKVSSKAFGIGRRVPIVQKFF